MNRIYRTLWSVATQSWQAVPETAKTAGKQSKSSAGGVITTVALGFTLAGVAHAQPPPAINQLPTGGTVVRGNATISQTATAQAAAMTVNQSSQRAAVNWSTFNLGSAASINFVQPNAQAVTLNRVNDSNPSQIFGRITSNGQVFLSNANGVYFSPTSSVDVGAITATTHSISDDNFMSGKDVFERNNATGKVVNEGRISAALGGYVALLAPEVQNAGVVVARAGTVVMAAGETITLNIDGTGSLAGITTTPSTIATLVENKQAVLAPDGQIILSAVALNQLQAGVVKNSGSLEANSLVNQGGKIYLEGDDIILDRNSKIEAKGPQGGGTVLVGGDWQGSGDLRQATHVTMDAGSSIDASATDKGDGGKVVLWSDVHNADSVTRVNGSIKAEAGPNGGDGGRIETSGHVLNVDGIGISAQANHGNNGEWLLDPYNVYIMKDATTSSDETLASGTYTPGSAASYIKSSDLNTALSSANITVTTGGSTPGTSTGNIYVYDGLAWGANKLTLNAWNNIYVYFPINVTGTGSLALEYGQNAVALGNTSAYYIDAPVNLPTGANFSTKLGSNGTVKNFTVINDLGAQADAVTAPSTMSVQGMAATASLAGKYVLGSDIDATATQTWTTLTNGYINFIPIGNATTNFTGVFDGLGHQVKNLKITEQSATLGVKVGFFGSVNNASITNIGLTNVAVSSVNGYYIGSLMGGNNNADSTILNNIFTSGSVSGGQRYAYIGGVAGMMTGGSASNIASASTETNTNAITTNYTVGGIFGLNQNNSKVDALAYYGTVTVTNNATTGALIGKVGTAVTNSYYDSTKNPSPMAWRGSSSSSSGTNINGLATSQLTTQSNFSGLDFANVWAMGASYPVPQFMLNNLVHVLPSSTSIVYGNTPTATLTYVGLQNGDTPATAFTTAPTAAAPSNTNVGSQTFYASGGVSSSYSFVYDAGTVTITPKPLFVTGLTVPSSRVYTGFNSATVTGTPILLTSETKGAGTDTDGKPYTNDTLSISITNGVKALATYNSKDVADATTITYSGFTLSGASAGNYTLVYPSVAGTITPKALTLNSPTGLTLTATKTYDGTNTATVIGTLTGGTITGEAAGGSATATDGKYYNNTGDSPTVVLGVTPTATYNQNNVGTGLTITYSYVGALTGTGASNYTLSSLASSTGAINKATLSLTGSQVYNGTTNFLGSNLLATGVAGQTFALTGNNATLGSANVTSTPVSQSFAALTLGASSNGGLASNYNTVATTSNVSVSITPATASLSGLKVYDATTGLTGTQLTITGVAVGGTSQTLGYSGTANLFDANVATANNYVVGSGLSLTNGTGLASNYVLPAFSYNSTYNHASVSAATAVVSASKTYDTGVALSAGDVTLTGVSVNGVAQNLGYTGTATLSDPNVATANKYVNTSSMVLANGTGLASNYALPSASRSSNNTASIQPLALVVSGISAATSVYGDALTPGTVSFSNVYSADAASVGGAVSVTVPAGDLSSSGKPNAGTYAQVASTSLTGAQASNYSFAGFTSANYTVAQRTLTGTGISASQSTYGSALNPGTVSFSNGLVGDQVAATATVNATSLSTANLPNAGTYTQTAGNTLSGADAGNYVFAGYTTTTANYTIDPKILTVSGLSASSSRVYDGTQIAVVSGTAGLLTAQTVGTGNSSDRTPYVGDVIGLTGTATGTYNSKDVASANLVTFGGLSSSNSNYVLSFETQTASITPKNLNISGLSVATSKVYDGSRTATVSGTASLLTASAAGSGSNADGAPYAGDVVSVVGTAIGTYDSKDVATASAVSYSGLSLSGLQASNYALAVQSPSNATITPKALTVAANNATKTYGDANPVLSTTVSGFVNGETLATSGVTGAGVATTTAATITGAGTATITAGVGTLAAGNYDFTNLVNGTLTINKAHLTVAANNATKTYGDANPVLSTTVNGFVNGETLATSGVIGAGTATTTATTHTGAGTATITAGVGTLAASNYDFTTLVNGLLTINKANATVTASSGTTTYNGLAQSVSGFTATGLVNGEAASVLSGVTASGSGTNAGTYTSTASGTDSNYNLTFVNGALTINKANATVTASSGTTTYNGLAQSVSGFTATGLVNGETASVLSGVTASGSGTNAGTYTSTASGTDSNYNLTFVNGALTINKAPLSVSLSNQTKVYDGTTNASIANPSYTLSGFVTGEGGSVAQTQGNYNSANVVGASTVSTTLAAGNFTANNGTLLSNYVLPTSASGTGNITPARLSATGTKIYDGLNSFDGAALNVAGVNGETFTASGTGTMVSKNVQSNQALSSASGISLLGNNGALASNYTTLATSDTQVSVTPLAVNMSAPSANKTYDGTTLYEATANDLATLSAQLVGSDRVSAAEVVYGNKDAGTGRRVTLNSVTISDDNGGNNYTVGKLDVLTGIINKAPLTVSVVNDARFINQTDTTGFAGVVYTGLVGGETASVLTTGNITRSNASVNAAGQYNGVLQASGWQSNNYAISYNAGDYTVAGAHTLLVRVPTASTTYGTAALYTPTAEYLDASNNSIMTLAPVMTGNALSVNDSMGGQASFAITAANAALSSSGNVQAGGYNLQASNITKTGSNFQNLVVTGGLTVTPKTLNSNLGVQSITKVYDGSASISNLGLNFNQPLAGVTTGDSLSLVGSGSFDDRHVGTHKTVNLSLGLRGTDAANYALTNANLSTNVGEITQLASVTYTGAANGLWSDASNWAGGALPDRSNVAQVVVPTGKTVVYNTDQVGVMGSALAVEGAVRFASGNPFTLNNSVSGSGDLQQRGTGTLTVSGTNTNFSGSLDIGAYAAELGSAQALGTGHVTSNAGQLSIGSALTLPSLHINGATTIDTTVKTTGDQVYNGALTFLSSGTTQAPNFVSDSGNINFLSTVSAGTGAMNAQRALVVSAPHGSVLVNDQVGRTVRGLDLATYLASGLSDTSPYVLTITAPTIKINGDVTTFESQTYAGAVRVGSNGSNGHNRLLVSVDPSITFKGTVDDADPTGKVNTLDVRAISLAALIGNATVPTITFENDVGGVSPLAGLRVASGIQSAVPSAAVTDIQTDDASRRAPHYKGDIVLRGDIVVDNAPLLIAEQLVTAPNANPSISWSNGQADFKLRLPAQGSSVLPSNLHLVDQSSHASGGGNTGSNTNSANTNRSDELATEAGKQWLMAHHTNEHDSPKISDDSTTKPINLLLGQMVADVKVGNETDTNVGGFIQVREFSQTVLRPMQPFIYKLPEDTFVHSDAKAPIKLSASLSNGAALPGWLKFSAKESRFSGTPPKGVKSLEVTVSATDHLGQRASTRVRLVFSNDIGGDEKR